jgi:hypothetical protein
VAVLGGILHFRGKCLYSRFGEPMSFSIVSRKRKSFLRLLKRKPISSR